MPMYQILTPVMTPSSKPNRNDSPSLQNQWGYYEVSWKRGPAIQCGNVAEAFRMAKDAGAYLPTIDGVIPEEYPELA